MTVSNVTPALKWPDIPKLNFRRLFRTAPEAQLQSVSLHAPDEVLLVDGADVPAPTDLLEQTLQASAFRSTIAIPAGFNDATPIVLDATTACGGVLVINIGAGAHVNISESWRGAGAKQLRALIYLVIGEDAVVNYETLDLLGDCDAVINRRAVTAARAELTWRGATFGDQRGATVHSVDLIGVGSKATANVAALVGGHTDLVMTTSITNVGQHTQGLINQHGVITGSAKLIINGIGHIVKGARGSDAQQENRVLMLSPTAMGDANPLLLIDENDVTAGHAASVAAIDETQLHYLLSRGLELNVALRLVIRGFLLSLLGSKFTDDQQREIRGAIERKLEHVGE